jgi:predicted secreted protein with PEFG-CTERM motif
MQGKYAMTLFLTSVLILTIANFIFANDKFASPLHIDIAYAQSPPDFGGTSDLGAPTDNSTDLGGTSNAPSDNSTDLGLVPEGNLTGNVSSAQNSTVSTATPEFGSTALAVLVLSIVSIIIISTRTRLRFSRF